MFCIFAWFAADAAVTGAKGAAQTASVVSATSTMQEQTYYLDVTVAPSSSSSGVEMTSSDGVAYALVNSKLQKAKQDGTKTEQLEITYKWMDKAAGVAGRTEVNAFLLSNIKAGTARLEFVVGTNTSTRIRLGANETISNQVLGGTVSIFADVAAGGAVTFYNAATGNTNASVYYSITGGLVDTTDDSEENPTDQPSSYWDTKIGDSVVDDGNVSTFNSSNAETLLQLKINPAA